MWVLLWIALDFDPVFGEWDSPLRNKIRIENEYPTQKACEQQLMKVGLNSNMEVVRDGYDLIAKSYVRSSKKVHVYRCEKIGIVKFQDDGTITVSPEY
jgi:hypothetical protein